MIAYEIQLWYVIRDRIQSEKNIFLSEKKKTNKLSEKKNLSQMLSWISSAQSELSRTNRCLSSLSGMLHTAIIICTEQQRFQCKICKILSRFHYNPCFWLKRHTYM